MRFCLGEDWDDALDEITGQGLAPSVFHSDIQDGYPGPVALNDAPTIRGSGPWGLPSQGGLALHQSRERSGRVHQGP